MHVHIDLTFERKHAIPTTVLAANRRHRIKVIIDRAARNDLGDIQLDDILRVQVVRKHGGGGFDLHLFNGQRHYQSPKDFNGVVNGFLDDWNTVVNSTEEGFDHRLATAAKERIFTIQGEPNFNHQGVLKIGKVAGSTRGRLNIQYTMSSLNLAFNLAGDGRNG